MKKNLFAVIVVIVILTLTTSTVLADEYVDDIPKDSHKIRNKWDLTGTFVAYPGYNWGGLAEGATWNYDIHIKEAVYGEYSVGSVHFWTGDIDVVGSVKATKQYFSYWPGENIAAVGLAEYNDQTYYFMLIYAQKAVWMAISQYPYDTAWANNTALGNRAYQLHSLNTNDFLLDYKAIHE